MKALSEMVVLIEILCWIHYKCSWVRRKYFVDLQDIVIITGVVL